MQEQIIELIAKQLELDPSTLSGETDIVDDLGADSLDIVELLMSIDEKFGINVPDEDAVKLKTVNDIVAYIEERR